MSEAEIALLRQVGYLASLDDEALRELAAGARHARYIAGERIVSELESGADVFVILRGEAEVSVDARTGDRQVVGRIGPGGAFGEMSSLTGELRSATVTATGDVEVLRIADADFDRLRERRPEVAVALVRLLAERIAAAERAIDAITGAQSISSRALEGAAHDAGAPAEVRRGSIVRAWRELVVNRRRDLPFLTLAGFAATLVLVRATVYLAFRFDWHVREVLRSAYTTGFGLLGLSAAVALLTYRAEWRRAVAIAYGVGCALIFNSLGVTLAFDIFYKDIHTPDPNHPFDIETLYRRTEPIRAIVIGAIVLFQAAYLRPFYRRAAFVVRTRLRKVFARERPL